MRSVRTVSLATELIRDACLCWDDRHLDEASSTHYLPGSISDPSSIKIPGVTTSLGDQTNEPDETEKRTDGGEGRPDVRDSGGTGFIRASSSSEGTIGLADNPQGGQANCR